VVRDVMLNPLPYRDPERIVSIWESNARRNRPRNAVGPANFLAWRERNRSFEHFGIVGLLSAGTAANLLASFLTNRPRINSGTRRRVTF